MRGSQLPGAASGAARAVGTMLTPRPSRGSARPACQPPASPPTAHTHTQGLPSPGGSAAPPGHADTRSRWSASTQRGEQSASGEPPAGGTAAITHGTGCNNSRHLRASALGLPSALGLRGCSALAHRGWSRHSAWDWGRWPGVWSSSQTCTTGWEVTSLRADDARGSGATHSSARPIELPGQGPQALTALMT